MSYASTIWGTSNKILLNRILKLQKRAARTIMFERDVVDTWDTSKIFALNDTCSNVTSSILGTQVKFSLSCLNRRTRYSEPLPIARIRSYSTMYVFKWLQELVFPSFRQLPCHSRTKSVDQPSTTPTKKVLTCICKPNLYTDSLNQFNNRIHKQKASLHSLFPR